MPPSHGDQNEQVLAAIPRHLLPNYKGHVRYGVRGRHFFVQQASPLRVSTGESLRTPLNPPFHYAKDHRSQKLHLYTITAAPEYRGWSMEELRLMDYQNKYRRKIPHPYPPPVLSEPLAAVSDPGSSKPVTGHFFQMPPLNSPESSGFCSPDTSDILWRPIAQSSNANASIYDEVSPFSTERRGLCSDDTSVPLWHSPGRTSPHPEMDDSEPDSSPPPIYDGVSVEESRVGFYQTQTTPPGLEPPTFVFPDGEQTHETPFGTSPFFKASDQENPSSALHYQSISFMPQYRSMSMEELRVHDYHVLRHQAAHEDEVPFTEDLLEQQDNGTPIWTNSEFGTPDHTPSLHDLLQAYPGPTQLQPPSRQQSERRTAHHDVAQAPLPMFKTGIHPGLL